MLQSKHLDDDYESSEEEREPPTVPLTWRALQPALTAQAQMSPQPPVGLTSQTPSRHVLCLPPRNVTLLQERVRCLPSPLLLLHSSLTGQLLAGTQALISPAFPLPQANKLVKYLMIKDYKKIPIKRSGRPPVPLPERHSSPSPPQLWASLHSWVPSVSDHGCSSISQHRALAVLPSAGLTQRGAALLPPLSPVALSNCPLLQTC